MEHENTELLALALQADALDSEATASGPQAMMDQAAADETLQQESGNTTQVRFIFALAVPLLGKIYPSIGKIYDDATCDQVSSVLGPVLTKYGVDLSDMSTKWGPEIACLMVCGPIAMATVAGIKEDIAASQAQAPKAVASNAPQAPAPAGETAVLG